MTAGSRTVLVADDDRTTRVVLAYMLRRDGYRVEQAERGEKCLILAAERPIDAFLVDINMPGLGGIELCRRLRGMERYRATPIIFVTALDESSKLQEVFEAGADDFISKPVDPVTLRARLTGHLQKAGYFLEMERIRRNMSRYISTRTQRMVEAYSVSGELPLPEQHDVCVLFSDVRGFTALTRVMEPERLFERLSRHLGMQVDTVYRHGGYIDKFGGDGVMAVFESEDAALNACRCALDIMDRTRRAHGGEGARMFELGIGIHAGPVLIGNIGSEEHLDYSAIGETVNLAARLCGCAEPMSIVVSESVRLRAAGEAGLRFGDPRPVQLRGIQEPVQVYALLG